MFDYFCSEYNKNPFSLVGVFVQKLLFGNTGDSIKDKPFIFPASVNHLRDRFQQKYGYRGRHLIDQLGNGSFRYSSGFMPCSSCTYR